MWDLHFEDVPKGLQTAYVVFGCAPRVLVAFPADAVSPRLSAQIMFDLSTTFCKLSMLALVYRITTAGRSRVRFAVLAIAGIVAADGIAFALVAIFQCR